MLAEGLQAVAAYLKKRVQALKEYRIDPEETDISEVPARLKSLNMFGDAYLYVVPNLTKKRFDRLFFDELLGWAQAGEHRHALAIGVTEPFDHPLWAFLENHGRIHKVEVIRKEDDWQEFGGGVIDRFLAQRDLRIAPDARKELLHRCYLNPARLKSELSKLADYASGGSVGRKDVERIVGDEFYEEYALVKALQERDPAGLRKEMRRLMEEEGRPDMILAVLANEVRFYLLLKSVLPPEEQVLDNKQFVNHIYPKLKPFEKEFGAVDERYARRMKNGWALFHAYKALSHYTPAHLKRLLKAVSDANIRLRQGVPVEDLLARIVFTLGPKPKATRA